MFDFYPDTLYISILELVEYMCVQVRWRGVALFLGTHIEAGSGVD